MTDENKIRELQRRIDSLASEILQVNREVQLLQQELLRLQGKASPPLASAKGPTFENFIGLRFMHIAGIIVLVTGLSIGVKYAIDRQLIPEWLRIALAYTASAVLLFISYRLRARYSRFSAILFSGSMASAYFTTYAAFVYYHFFPGAAAFIFMAILTVFTVYSAITYDRQEIAVLGMVGAYGIPFLISQNSERVELLFSYILLINIGILFITFRKSWRPMQYIALIITWTLYAGWATFRSTEGHEDTGLFFIIAYYCMFLTAALAQRMRTRDFILPGEMQQLIINNAALYLSCLLLFSDGFTSRFAFLTGCITASLFVLTLMAVWILPSEHKLQRLLAWQAIFLLTLFTGAQWSGVAVTLIWMAMAVLLFTWGAYAGKSWPRLASTLLIVVTLGKLVLFDSGHFSTVQKILSFLIIGILLLAFSFYYQRYNLPAAGKDRKP